MPAAVITIGIDPEISLGPLLIAWHGLTIAIGILVGGLAAARIARERGLGTEPLYTIGALATLGGLLGGRLLYVLEHGGPLLGTTGFSFDGGVILAGALIAAYLWHERLSGRYLDVIALALPLGVAIGRIGDVISGEHYGPRSDFFLAVRNSNPHALTPDPHFAYQNGGLYEVLLGALIFALVWPLRHRLGSTGTLAWLVLGLFSLGRFFEFFLRSDSPSLALGLANTQWVSLGMLAVAVAGWRLTLRRRRGGTAARRGGIQPGPAKACSNGP